MAEQPIEVIVQKAKELIDKSEQCFQSETSPKEALPDPDELLSLYRLLFNRGELIQSRRLFGCARKAAARQARELADNPPLDEGVVLELAKKLTGLYEHGAARRLLAQLLEQGCSEDNAEQVYQRLSLNTYKDEELPPEDRFNDALALLERIGLRNPDCISPETLGQGGAIYKRKFDRSGQLEDLQTAYYYYQKGWKKNPQRDMGYCGVNAAYLLDLLAYRERSVASREQISDSQSAQCRRVDELQQEALSLRRELQSKLPGFAEVNDRERPTSDQWWYLVTMAEIAFGLQEWEEAGQWLSEARLAEHFEWERETTTRQLVAIARIQGFVPPQAGKYEEREKWEAPWRALAELLGSDASAAFECFRGKVGLALSGGGFRASFFHLGVLARLAEIDALRSVEVLSTVSGGSIVGAHYYLALRRLLESKTDDTLTREDYIELVNGLIDQFFKGVSENLRVRAFSSFRANMKMLFKPNYGRSNRMGELYETYLYDGVLNGGDRETAGDESAPLHPMRDLLIHPMTEDPFGGAIAKDETFKPKWSNWRRRCKVPTLLLNTTSLNSGHNWHFTASWMGEPPGLTGQDIDMNERYRRLYYRQAPTEELRNYPLGYAVAASAGVPALFDPLELKGLYPGRTVRLVDGGVHDNQGVAGLLDESCDLILCSDASGQMDDQDSPAKSALSVFYRSDSILQDRIRESQYQDLESRNKSHALQGLFFVHLKQELTTDPIDWIECDNPTVPSNRNNQTSYGIDRTLQRRLAEMRTDLDTFSEVEACALMASGYAMARHQLAELDKQQRKLKQNDQGTWADFDIHGREEEWPFSGIMPILAADPDGSDRKARDLELQLRVSKRLFGKAWYLIPTLRVVGIAAVTGLAILAGGLLYRNWQTVVQFELSVAGIASVILFLLGLTLLPLGKYFKPLDTTKKWLGLTLLASFGWLASNAYLLWFNVWFKQRGTLERLLRLPQD